MVWKLPSPSSPTKSRSTRKYIHDQFRPNQQDVKMFIADDAYGFGDASSRAVDDSAGEESDEENIYDIELIDSPINHASCYKLCDIDCVPPYLRMPHIHSGYRLHFSLFLCIYSFFRLHNNTINVYTHALPIFLFVYLLLEGMISSSLTVITLVESAQSLKFSALDSFYFHTFHIAAIITFMMSSMYHLFSCHSPIAHKLLLQCDLSGIICLVIASYLPGLHYVFNCRPFVKFFYSFIIVFLTSFYLFLLFKKRYARRFCRFSHNLRVGIIVALVMFAICPVFHFLVFVTGDFPALAVDSIVVPLAVMLGLYGLGFVFYASRFPECFWPGKFDIFGHSHQYWHICVVLAAIVWRDNLIRLHKAQELSVCGFPTISTLL